MNTNLTEWRAPERRPSTLQMVPLVAKEVRRRNLLLAAMFAGIALTALVIGLRTPKAYTSSTTLLVEESNIIEPLLKGRTVPTSVVDRAAIAREVAFSGKVMNEILREGGWLAANPDALQRAKIIDQITDHTVISNPRENLKLVEIAYTDSDPQRAHRVTGKFADLIIQESFRTKERESRAAFKFIDSQVGAYHGTLADAESKLQKYRAANPDVLFGSVEEASRRIADLRMEVDKSMMDQADQRSQAGAWQSHLSRERSIGVTNARSGQIGARLAELQAERDKLAGNYTDKHPDVVRVQHQIRDLEAQLQRGGGGPVSGAAAVAAISPAFADVRGRVTEASSRSAASASRVAMGQALLSQELGRLNRLAETGGEFANLTRNFEVNRDLYQDLLERRENARLSMNLDAQRGGLNFRVQEPANIPLQANGVGLTQIALAGLLLAIVLPLLALVGWLRMDPRVRTAGQIEQLAGLPVLGSIPPRSAAAGGHSRRSARSRQQALLATALLLSVPIAYALVLTLN